VAVARACADAGKGFSLVTPVVREGWLPQVSAYLQKFVEAVPGVECVCNDWGLLHRARQEQLPMRLTAGRLLSRQRRGPRTVGMLREASPEEVRALRGSIWSDPLTAELLHDLGIGRVELDFLLQGTERPNLPGGIDLTICAPWIPVSVTPACEYAEDPLHCDRGCLAHGSVRRESGQDPQPLWSRGNAQFSKSELQAPYQAAAKLGADRLVWAENLPG
jgi:hypothetical protein